MSEVAGGDKGFAVGDVVYLQDGEEAELLAVGQDYNVVAMVDQNGDPYPPQIAERIYREPPTARVHARVEALKKQCDELGRNIQHLHREQQLLEGARQETTGMLERHRALGRIVEHLEGKTTHFVVNKWNGVEVVEAEQALSCGRDESDKMARKLLVLFGVPGRGLAWRINDYKDGSGSWTTCVPCTSLEEALGKAAEMLAAKVEKVQGDHNLPAIVDNYRKLGIQVDAGIAKRARASLVAAARDRLDKQVVLAEQLRVELRAWMDDKGAP